MCCYPLANAAIDSIQHALELEPDNIDAYVAYLDLLLELWFPYDVGSYPWGVPEAVAAALAVAPENEQILDLVQAAARTSRFALDRNPDSNEIQAVYEDMRTVLAHAEGNNPYNQRLFDIYREFIQPPAAAG